MRKKSILNLIKCHAEKNEDGFRKEAYDIARYFDKSGDTQLAQYIMALLSSANTFIPQDYGHDHPLLTAIDPASAFLQLPSNIEDDIRGVISAIRHKAGVHKFLFEGDPGTGKTETVKRIAHTLNRELYAVDFDAVIDSKLGQTSKNIAAIFRELHDLPRPERAIILFDEIDAIALDRINSNDLREMGRVTSSVLKGLDGLNSGIILIATTNLYAQFDKALTRRFDLTINFNRYSQNDLAEVAESILNSLLRKFKFAGRNMRLFRKILATMDQLPHPGQLKNIIRAALALSDPKNEYSYLAKLYKSINSGDASLDLRALKGYGFTIREMSILTSASKSQIARELRA